MSTNPVKRGRVAISKIFVPSAPAENRETIVSDNVIRSSCEKRICGRRQHFAARGRSCAEKVFELMFPLTSPIPGLVWAYRMTPHSKGERLSPECSINDILEGDGFAWIHLNLVDGRVPAFLEQFP
ncbi:MAG: hypothetical protein ACRCSX_04345, partial [Allorhizobium sp.]